MTEYDNTNSGALFKNENKTNERQPNLRGSLNVDGTEYWVSGWTKTIKNGPKAGNKMISLAVTPKDEGVADLSTEDDEDIPF